MYLLYPIFFLSLHPLEVNQSVCEHMERILFTIQVSRVKILKNGAKIWKLANMYTFVIAPFFNFYRALCIKVVHPLENVHSAFFSWYKTSLS